MTTCINCNGTGTAACRDCKGSGQHFFSDSTGSFAEQCENCLGKGTALCPACGWVDHMDDMHIDFIETLTKKLAQIDYRDIDATAKAEKAEADNRVRIDWALEYSGTFYFEVNDSAFEASFTPNGIASLTRVRGSL